MADETIITDHKVMIPSQKRRKNFTKQVHNDFETSKHLCAYLYFNSLKPDRLLWIINVRRQEGKLGDFAFKV